LPRHGAAIIRATLMLMPAVRRHDLSPTETGSPTDRKCNAEVQEQAPRRHARLLKAA